MLEQFHPARIDMPRCYGILQCTSRFMSVMAVVKTALAEIFGKLHEALFDSAEAQMVQSKGLHSGAIDQIALVIYLIHPRMCGGVLAG